MTLLIVVFVLLVLAVVAAVVQWLRKRRSGRVLIASSPGTPLDTKWWHR